MNKITPMMQQWHDCKAEAKKALLFFRLGDFYEAFYDDAEILSKELDLTLTKRGDIPMCGVPAHTIDGYIEKIVAKGFLLAIAEQIEDPKEVKGIVKRKVVRTISPATIIGSGLVEEKSNNFFASLCYAGGKWGLALADVSTGELSAIEPKDTKELFDELSRKRPTEILISQSALEKTKSLLSEYGFTCARHEREDWHFDSKTSKEWLQMHFGVSTLDGFGLQNFSAGIGSVGALLSYLRDELSQNISHMQKVMPVHLSGYLSIDQTTQRHLELIRPLHDEKKGATLLELLDETQTAMGGRLLKNWVIQPLLSLPKIEARQNAIEELISFPNSVLFFRKHLSHIRDLERLIMRVETAQASPKDVAMLRVSLQHIEPIHAELTSLTSSLFKTIATYLPDIDDLLAKLESALVENPPLRITDGELFKRGYNSELDELLSLKENSQAFLLKYQQELRDSLGIKNLRVNFNRAFGYFIEVSRGQAEKMPAHFERRQTLVNAERFISPKLKEFEHKILSAEEQTKALEHKLFTELRTFTASKAKLIRNIGAAIAHLDCLYSLTVISRRHEYVRPKMDDSDSLEIFQGKHPVIECAQTNEHFIPNDTLLDPHTSMMLITGPNMAGKSTYIRQVALLVIMAQIGCFVPAEKACIGLVDKVFSRIGASDDLSRGQSTFMVEMTETANILNNATPKSLIILDEIGRGTSTYDGIAIAWSVAQYLLTKAGKKAKTLFATHYHELTSLSNELQGVKNYNVAVKETDSGIVFLRKIVPGSTDKSFGIHVARLAGIPESALRVAKQKLKELEEKSAASNQLSLFSTPAENPYESLGETLKELDVNRVTPLEALEHLANWQKKWT